jgi:hypothetical protein
MASKHGLAIAKWSMLQLLPVLSTASCHYKLLSTSSLRALVSPTQAQVETSITIFHTIIIVIVTTIIISTLYS